VAGCPITGLLKLNVLEYPHPHQSHTAIYPMGTMIFPWG